jgi:hypothetical protein
MIPMESTQAVALERASSLGVLELFIAHPRNLVGPLSGVRESKKSAILRFGVSGWGLCGTAMGLASQ